MSDKVDFDEYSSSYNTLLHEHTAFFSASEAYFARYKVDIARARVAAPIGRLLEFGCGIGRNIRHLQHAFPDAAISGYDISAASLEVARAENPGAAFTADIDALAGPYDLIFVAGVFHHIAVGERAGVAKRLRALLAPAGELMVFEHNPYNPVTRRIVSNCPYDADAVLLRPAELRGLLAGAGFATPTSGYCLFVPPRLAWLAPLEHVLGWLPLGGQYWVHAGAAPALP